jgi:hypothetical protein
MRKQLLAAVASPEFVTLKPKGPAMTETPDQLAALDRAATQTYDLWEAELAHTKLGDALIALYRAEQLVLIGPDAVEKVARAMAELHLPESKQLWKMYVPLATAVIAAITGRV